jgi:hypothetical protein
MEPGRSKEKLSERSVSVSGLLMGAISRIKLEKSNSMEREIWFFGHFGSPNFGDEITLQAILHHLRRGLPDAKFA